MIYWHGTGVKFRYFDLSYSRDLMDFGSGIYLSESREHALSIARAKAIRTGAAYVFKYKVNMTDIRKALKVKEFKGASKEWLEFILMNRVGYVQTDYDIIIGPTADARANEIIKNYYNRYVCNGYKILGADYRLLKEQLKVNRYATQICLKTQKAVDIFNANREV